MKKRNLVILFFATVYISAICGCSKDDAEENQPANRGVTNGHEWVNLGLPSGTLWATCNVGASKPEEYGDYYAWGETQTKSDYSWWLYKYSDGSSSSAMTKYNETDNLKELLSEDDVATTKWGSSWQIPSRIQCEELINGSYTTIVGMIENGISGWKITSKSNGNYIFLPAAGYRSNANLKSVGIMGGYYSRSLDASEYSHSFSLFLESSDIYTYSERRDFGATIRPVRKK